MTDAFEITYAAHTATCTFLLDAEGICRRIVENPVSGARGLRSGREASRVSSRCVGAQYVASLDSNALGMLAEKPRVGTSMLFARIDERGRISLVRTGAITRFERHQVEDPFLQTKLPSMSVETSAPAIEPSTSLRRFNRTAVPSELDGSTAKSVEGLEARALSNMGPGAFLRLHAVATDDDENDGDEAEPLSCPDDDDELARTCEYQSNGTAQKAWSSGSGEVAAPLQATLRRSHTTIESEATMDRDDDQEDPYLGPTAATAAVRVPVPLPRPPSNPSVLPPPLPVARLRGERPTRGSDPVTTRTAGYAMPEKAVRRR